MVASLEDQETVDSGVESDASKEEVIEYKSVKYLTRSEAKQIDEELMDEVRIVYFTSLRAKHSRLRDSS